MVPFVKNEISISNKVLEIAICGNVILTPEVHKLACERNGVINGRKEMMLIIKAFREMWRNEEIANRAKRIVDNYNLNVEEFNDTKSLYKKINEGLAKTLKV